MFLGERLEQPCISPSLVLEKFEALYFKCKCICAHYVLVTV